MTPKERLEDALGFVRAAFHPCQPYERPFFVTFALPREDASMEDVVNRYYSPAAHALLATAVDKGLRRDEVEFHGRLNENTDTGMPSITITARRKAKP